MNNFLLLPDDSKRFVVEQTALLQGLSKQVVEKDLWVSTILEIVFTLPYADKLVFNRMLIMEYSCPAIGIVRLTVGQKRSDGAKVQYCITAIDVS